jgi:hypothetical protein
VNDGIAPSYIRTGRYEPPDDVLESFHASKALVRGVRGPRGSGKSAASIMEGMQGAGTQNVNHEGRRRSRFLVLRDTYRQLETTTIPSFKKWLGPYTRFSGVYPIKGFTRAPNPDGSVLEMETVFLAMDGENIIDNLQSFEASFAWINEARAIQNRNVVNMVIASCGRYPSKDEEGCPNAFVVMDTNPCDEFHWWHDADVKETPSGWAFFAQASPLIYLRDAPTYYDKPAFYKPNPAATYARIQNKGYDYWLDQIPGATDPFIRTMVMGKYGTLVAGKPVYEKYWHEDCLSPTPIEAHPSLPIVVGIDTSGLHPGAVFCQAYQGRVNALHELHAADSPFDQFCEAVLMPTINERYRMNPIIAVVDPSNPRYGVGGKTALQILIGYGIDAVLARTNRLNERLGAVTKLLQRRGALAIDPGCKILVEGFRGKYHYKKIDTSGVIVAYKPVPEKDKYADVHDGFQYVALYYSGGTQAQKVIVPPRKVMMV